MIHIFQSLDGTTFLAEHCDIGITDSPIHLEIAEHNSKVTLDVNTPGWYMMGCIFEMIFEADDAIDTHAPIVDLVASIHWAACAEPDAMGVI